MTGIRSIDRLGNLTTTQTYVERATGTRVVITDYPDSDIDGEQVYVKGLLTSAQDKTGKTLSYGYDAWNETSV